MTDVTIHACPIGDSALTPCCGRVPFELTWERITLDISEVTCRNDAVSRLGAEVRRLRNVTPFVVNVKRGRVIFPQKDGTEREVELIDTTPRLVIDRDGPITIDGYRFSLA